MLYDEKYDEAHLLLRIAEGDESVFTTFFRRYTASLGTLAFRILRDEVAKEDVLQEVFIKVWLHRDQLPEITSLPAWLKKITLNESLMYLRKNAAYDKRLSAVKQNEYTENTAVQTIAYKELQQRLHACIQQMPEQRRKIYEINRLEGLSPKEIAEKMGLSYGHVRNALSMATKNVRESLGITGSPVFLALIEAFLMP